MSQVVECYRWFALAIRPSHTSLLRFQCGDPDNVIIIGSWNLFSLPNDNAIFNSSFYRPSRALGATVTNTGFFVGGDQDKLASIQAINLTTDLGIPGIASFNITSSKWSNDTAPEGITNSFLAPVPPFGPSGLLLSSGSSGQEPQSQSLNNITIYEPIGKTWHTQNLTGNAPTARQFPCTVGMQGDNGTYEM